MDMHHCPRCELRFVNTSELRQHFAVDHGGDASTFERYRYRSGPASRPVARTLLWVGNQTLEDEQVLHEVLSRAGDGARVVVLVPATPSRHQTGGRPPAGGEAGEDAGEAIARWRLGVAVDRLRAAGVEAEGRVGVADPFAAVSRALADEQIDEILVSTLPPSSSRWLGVDLPDRLRRHTSRPVAVLTPTPTSGWH